jgi:gamma-glutamylcyclotransferase (GGCT)/AIG2-like uncharacterized protein YtfP
MNGAKFEGEACLYGHYLVLYKDAYPAMAQSPPGEESSHVLGEFFRVNHEHLGRLDEFEECPMLYQRCSVRLAHGRVAEAYTISAECAALHPAIGSTWLAETQRMVDTKGKN